MINARAVRFFITFTFNVIFGFEQQYTTVALDCDFTFLLGTFFEDVTVNASDPEAKFMASDL
jgi:hypothetical protein